MKRAASALGFVGLLILGGWLGFRSGESEPMAVMLPDPAANVRNASPPSVRPPATAPNAAGGPMKPGEMSPWPGVKRTTSLEPPKLPPPPPTGGEMLHQWLSSSQDTDKVADTVLNNWSKLKPEDHAAAVKALMPLVTDDRCAGLQRLLLDPATSLEAKQLLFKNLQRRPKDVHLPLYLAILRQTPAHPYEAEARVQLNVRLGQDYGYDWAAWQARIDQELAP